MSLTVTGPGGSGTTTAAVDVTAPPPRGEVHRQYGGQLGSVGYGLYRHLYGADHKLGLDVR